MFDKSYWIGGEGALRDGALLIFSSCNIALFSVDLCNLSYCRGAVKVNLSKSLLHWSHFLMIDSETRVGYSLTQVKKPIVTCLRLIYPFYFTLHCVFFLSLSGKPLWLSLKTNFRALHSFPKFQSKEVTGRRTSPIEKVMFTINFYPLLTFLVFFSISLFTQSHQQEVYIIFYKYIVGRIGIKPQVQLVKVFIQQHTMLLLMRSSL